MTQQENPTTWQAIAARIVADADVPGESQRAKVGVSPLLINGLRLKLKKERQRLPKVT